MICRYHKEECNNSIDDTCDICMEKEIDRLRAELEHVRNFYDGACSCRFDEKENLAKECEAHEEIRRELERVKRERDFVAEANNAVLNAGIEGLKSDLSTERKAWDIYNAMYPGAYHSANFFRKKAQENGGKHK